MTDKDEDDGETAQSNNQPHGGDNCGGGRQ